MKNVKFECPACNAKNQHIDFWTSVSSNEQYFAHMYNIMDILDVVSLHGFTMECSKCLEKHTAADLNDALLKWGEIHADF